jgi:HAE1 family hydrophobic/amphiphilic exporter-1/multidrug efflux pump
LRGTHDVTFLHQPADLRVGHLDHHRDRRPDGLARAAHRPIPRNHPADGGDHRHLPGRLRRNPGKTVAAPIEEQLSGVENLLYFNSTASSNGSLTITASFEVGTNVDMATVNVNNRVKIAEPRLPDVVRQFGVTVQKRSNDILMVAALTSPDASRTPLFLSNYALVNVVDDLKRIPGVGDAQIFGALDYSIRLWLKPDRMAQLGVTATDVANAIAAQNRQNAAGKIGQEPAPPASSWYTVTAKGRLSSPRSSATSWSAPPARTACSA